MSNARKPTKRASARISRSSSSVHSQKGATISQASAANNVSPHGAVTNGANFRAAQSSASRPVKAAKRKSVKSSGNKALRIVGIIFIVLLALTTAAMAWNHWLRYDDAQDIQGEWKIEGSDSTIVFTENEIQLTESVKYAYELDTFAKTITFSFHSLQGSGSYAFSPERDVLIISEQDATGASDTIPSKLIKVSGEEPQDLTNNPDDEASTLGADIVAEGENKGADEGQ